jgi:hypothetical protein
VVEAMTITHNHGPLIVRHADPLPAPCVICGILIDWPARFAFIENGDVGHLACVEDRD